MIQKVLSTIEKHNMLELNDHVVLGLSGGADSVSLLYILREMRSNYNLKITAVHVNHNLRGEEAKRDEYFVINICKSLNIDIKVYTCSILDKAKELKLTVEETGREMRYKFFKEVYDKEKATKIAVAHNLNDQAETLIMNFFRGSGLTGLAGIPAVRGSIIRPLIYCKRQEIESYCKKRGINYIIDSSNNSLDYTRNKVRLELLPYIEKEFNPSILEALSRNAQILDTEEKYLSVMSSSIYEECVNSDNDMSKIDIAKFLNTDDAIKSRIIRTIFFKNAKTLKNFTSEHINMVISLTRGNTGKRVSLPYGIIAERSYNHLIIYKPEVHKDYIHKIELGSYIYIKEINMYISCGTNKKMFKEGFKNTCTKIFNYDKIQSSIYLRNRKSGDKIYIKNIGTKKVKDYFINKKVPRVERDKIPLILDGDNVMWVVLQSEGKYKELVSEYYKAKDTDINKIYIQLWEENK